MTGTRFERWSEIRKAIRFPNKVVEESVRKLTAPERHRWRIERAWEVAFQVLGPDKVLGDYMVATASSLLWLEAKGLYGGGDVNPGASTKRLRFFRNLGSGRRNAADGPAWTRAIGIAAHRHGHCEWAVKDGALAIRFEPHEVTDYQRVVTIPLRDVLFFDGDRSTDAVEAWIGACKHALVELAQPRNYDVGPETIWTLQAAVNEYHEANLVCDKAWFDEIEAQKRVEGKI